MAITNAQPAPVPAPSAAEISDLRDIRPPVEVPTGWEWLWWGLLVLALTLLGYFLYRWWRKRSVKKPVVAEVPPHIRTKQRLERALRLLPYPREFCIEVSDALRIYLEESFSLRAPERTTEEFLRELQETALLSAGQKTALAGFLQSCDLVKFARFEPTEPQLYALHESAVRLVDETAPTPVAHMSEPGDEKPMSR